LTAERAERAQTAVENKRQEKFLLFSARSAVNPVFCS
jgi:hypothetical protein